MNKNIAIGRESFDGFTFHSIPVYPINITMPLHAPDLSRIASESDSESEFC